MTPTTELKACPCCGCAPQIQFRPARDWVNIIGETRPGRDSYSITCRTSNENNYFSHLFTVSRDTKEEAIAAWNQRTAPERTGMVDVDKLANFIRIVDGNNDMAAGELAEKIIEFMQGAGK